MYRFRSLISFQKEKHNSTRKTKISCGSTYITFIFKQWYRKSKKAKAGRINVYCSYNLGSIVCTYYLAK